MVESNAANTNESSNDWLDAAWLIQAPGTALDAAQRAPLEPTTTPSDTAPQPEPSATVEGNPPTPADQATPDAATKPPRATDQAAQVPSPSFAAPTKPWPSASGTPMTGEFSAFASKDKAAFRAWQIVHEQTSSQPSPGDSPDDTASVQARHVVAAALQVVATVGVDRNQLAALLNEPGQLLAQVTTLFGSEDGDMLLAIQEAMPRAGQDADPAAGFSLGRDAVARAYPPN